MIKVHFNLNDPIVIYPNEKGWRKIESLIAERYLLSNTQAIKWVEARKTDDGGYKDQLWVIISDLHDMFYNGQSYFIHANITLTQE